VYTLNALSHTRYARLRYELRVSCPFSRYRSFLDHALIFVPRERNDNSSDDTRSTVVPRGFVNGSHHDTVYFKNINYIRLAKFVQIFSHVSDMGPEPRSCVRNNRYRPKAEPEQSCPVQRPPVSPQSIYVARVRPRVSWGFTGIRTVYSIRCSILYNGGYRKSAYSSLGLCDIDYKNSDGSADVHYVLKRDCLFIFPPFQYYFFDKQ